MSDVEYLDVEDVKMFHSIVATRAKNFGTGGGPYGVKNHGALESAVHRPRAGFGDYEKYTTVFEKAAVLAHGISQSHVFHNGNKRTALLSMAGFLRLNGYDFRIHPEDFEVLAEWGALSFNTIQHLLESPDFQMPLATEVYAEAFLTLLTYIESEEEDIGWGAALGCSLPRYVEWDWEIENFAGMTIQPDEETVSSLSSKLTDYLSRTFDDLSLKGLTLGSFCLEKSSGTWVFAVSQEVVDYCAELTQDETYLVSAATFVPYKIDGGESDPQKELDAAIEMAVRIYEDFDPDNISNETALKHVEWVENQRIQIEGYSFDLTVDTEEEIREYSGRLCCEITPLNLLPEEQDAHFRITPFIEFDDPSPDFEEWDDESLSQLVDEMREQFISTLKAAVELKADMVAQVLEGAFEMTRELRKARGDEITRELDESMPDRSAAMEAAADFMVEAVAESLSVEDIAAWLEQQVVPADPLEPGEFLQ